MENENILKIVRKQIAGLSILEFHKYWLENFIVKNKAVGVELMRHLGVKNLDALYNKLIS